MRSEVQLSMFDPQMVPELQKNTGIRDMVNRYKNKCQLAHHVFQNGKVEIITVFKEVTKSEAGKETVLFETLLNLHGIPVLLTHASREEALISHNCYCKYYKDV